MPFTVYCFRAPQSRAAEVRLSVHPGKDGARHKRHETPRLSLRIGDEVLKELGWPPDSRLAVAFGHGADLGWLEIAPATGPASVVLTRSGRQASSRLLQGSRWWPDEALADAGGKFHYAVDRSRRDAASVEHRLVSGRLRLRLPEGMLLPAEKAALAVERYIAENGVTKCPSAPRFEGQPRWPGGGGVAAVVED